jgi:hypothetical protein
MNTPLVSERPAPTQPSPCQHWKLVSEVSHEPNQARADDGAGDHVAPLERVHHSVVGKLRPRGPTSRCVAATQGCTIPNDRSAFLRGTLGIARYRPRKKNALGF